MATNVPGAGTARAASAPSRRVSTAARPGVAKSGSYERDRDRDDD